MIINLDKVDYISPSGNNHVHVIIGGYSYFCKIDDLAVYSTVHNSQAVTDAVLEAIKHQAATIGTERLCCIADHEEHPDD